MKLNDFYTSFLTGVGLVITEEGYVKLPVTDDVAGVAFPATVSKKSLVLPTDENLTKVVGENVIVFHPLNEDLERGPSKILEFVRLYSRQELEVQAILLMRNILRLTASTEIHKKLSPDQSEVLDVVKGLDTKGIERVIGNFDTLIDRLDVNSPEKSLIHIYLRRSGKIGEKAYRQVATVTFPIYEQLIEGESTILGVKFSKAAVKALTDVFEYVFPDIATKGAYNVGSNSNIAPKFEAVIGAVASMMISINRIIELVNTDDMIIFEECEPMNLEWVQQIGKFDEMHREIQMVPMQHGNEGELEIGEGGYNVVDTAEGSITKPAPKAAPKTVSNPAEAIRKRMAHSDTAPWEHESPRKKVEEVEITEEPSTRGSHLKSKPQPVETQGSSLKGFLQGQPLTATPNVYDPYAQGYQPPPPYPNAYPQAHHPHYPPQPYHHPQHPQHPPQAPQVQSGGVLGAVRQYGQVMQHSGANYPGQPAPYDMGQDGQHPLHYYGNGMPPRRR